ncbi:NAD(P)H-dependent oxidoreductase [Capnocytophaga sp.]|uniref:NAD(P)H-dependent oxidoreductase n=1 Tax=Capnocytophaga sp. TaxID=44737 RepID=UPI0026DA80D8|nr:NAD(P)H-dependent oxidoreductase [Capnocytophaga sp.]MDO5105888.1 NAD(P)H-dependent oxidoreductase [Capnocytophaga sp.]
MKDVQQKKASSEFETIVIYAHPYEKSFNYAILQETEKILKNRGGAYRTIDLYAEKFNPVYSKEELALFSKGEALDPQVLRYQQYLKQAKRLIFIFPIWWGNVPAIVKGFFDKVFLKTLAYEETKLGTLKGKLTNIEQAFIITTATAPTFYLKFFSGDAIRKIVINHTLKSVGVKKGKWLNCGAANKITDEKRQKFLKKISKYI